MTRHSKFVRRRARRNRILALEPLEFRLVLSSQAVAYSAVPAELIDPPPVFASTALNPVHLALANVTTSAPSDQFATIADPTPLYPADSDTAQLALAEAGPLIGLPAFRADPRFSGIDGSNYAVVVIDTGIDLDHPFFGPDADGNGVADRIVYSAEFVGDAPTAADQNGHGTHVSSIVASQDPAHPGIARGVNLIHLRVFNASGSGTAASIEAALQWVVAHAEEYNVVGVNMSLGFGDNLNVASTRPGLGLSDELAALTAQGVIVASAAGNSFFSYNGAPGDSYPAADPNSLSVGAVWDANAGGPYNWSDGARDVTTGADRIVSFSQRHPTLTTVFAPGAAITAAAIGGGTAVLSGTSMATPIITGVAALMQQLAVQATGNRLSFNEFAQLVRDTGTPIFDGDDEDDNVRNTQQYYHRVDLMALADAVLNPGLSNMTLPSGMSLASSAVPAGGNARLDFRIANQSTVATGQFTTGIYLSTDSIIDASDLLLTELSNDLAGGASVGFSHLAVPLPAGLAAGQYFIGAAIDAQGVVVESNETNNVAALPITVTGDGGEIFIVDAATDKEVELAGIINLGQVIQHTGNAVKTFRMTNDGNVDLVLTPPVVPLGFAIEGVPARLVPGQTTQFTVSLVSDSAIGVYDVDAFLGSNDPDENPFLLNLIGSILEPDDHGNDAAHATAMNAGETRNGKILRTGDVDWFSFAAFQGVRYNLETTLQTLGDSILRVVDTNGTTQLALNDDGPHPRASAIVWVAPSDGTYFLEVKGKNALQGTYQLTIGAEDDHGNGAANATPVNDPSANAGVIEIAGDSDWFTFTAVAAVEYRFETLLSSLAGSRLRVFDGDGQTQLAVAASQNVGDGALLQWIAPASGTFYIVVDAAGSSSIGKYRLIINADDDFGDDPANALPVALPASVPGRIDDLLDRDVFTFAAIGGAEYAFLASLEGLPGAQLRVIGPNGLTELIAQQGEPGAAVGLTWTPLNSGEYFIEIAGVGGTGAYTLDFSVSDDHGDDAANASGTTDPSVNIGRIELPTDVDWFGFDVIEGVAYHIEAALHGLSAGEIRLYAPDGQTALAVHGGVGVSPRLEWTAPADGRYFIAVNAIVGATLGEYRLAITGDDDHGDNPQNATPISIPLGVNGSIERPDDADWYAVKLLAGVEYRINVSLTTLPGVQTRLVGPDGVTELGTGIGGNGVPASVSFKAPVAGVYFVEVIPVALEANASSGATGGIVGDYEISASLVSNLPGDFDGDVDVDGNDFLVWQRTLRQGPQLPESPLDSEGFEQYAPGPLQAIPDEPTLSWHQLGSTAATAVVQSGGTAPGSQAVRIDRVYDPQNFDPIYGADAWWGVPLGSGAPTGSLVLVAWDMRVTATGAENGGLGPFFGVQAYDDHSGPIGLLGSLGVDATTLDVVYQNGQDGVIEETGVKATSGAWYSFALLFDFSSSEVTIYFEGRPLRTNEFVDLDLEGVSLDRITDADFVALASQADEPSQQMEGTAYVDNFRIAVGTVNELLPADSNQDGVVDGLDLAFWRQNFGTDYSGVASNFSTPQPVSGLSESTPLASSFGSQASALPAEPAPLALASLVAIAQRSATRDEYGPSEPPSAAVGYRPGHSVQSWPQARDMVLGAWENVPPDARLAGGQAGGRVEQGQACLRSSDDQLTTSDLETLWSAFGA